MLKQWTLLVWRSSELQLLLNRSLWAAFSFGGVLTPRQSKPHTHTHRVFKWLLISTWHYTASSIIIITSRALTLEHHMNTYKQQRSWRCKNHHKKCSDGVVPPRPRTCPPSSSSVFWSSLPQRSVRRATECVEGLGQTRITFQLRINPLKKYSDLLMNNVEINVLNKQCFSQDSSQASALAKGQNT